MMTDKQHQQQQQTKPISSEYQSPGSDAESESCSNYWQTLLTLFNTINHALVLLVTGYIVYLSRDLSSTVNLHVLLCTIGYVLLMSEAIVALTGENVWSRRLTRRSNSHLHWILQVMGAACSVAGVCFMYGNRRRHFRSTHSIVGITSVAAIAGLFISGLPALFAGRLRKVVRPVIGKFVHNFLGIGCFVVGMVAQCYGYQKRWLRRKVSEEWVMVFTVTTAMIVFFSLIGSMRSLFQQLKGLFRCR